MRDVREASRDFNAHDIYGFTELLADDAVVQAAASLGGTGEAACASFYGSWLTAFPAAHTEINGLHLTGRIAEMVKRFIVSQRDPVEMIALDDRATR